MGSWMKSKLTTIIIAAVAVFTVAGAGAVFASQSHPFTSSGPHTSDGASQQGHEHDGQENGNEFEAHGVIQQVTFDQGVTNSGSLVFLPDGKQATVNVTFTSSTKIELGGNENGSGHNDGDNDDHSGTPEATPSSSTNTSQPTALQAGMKVHIQGTMQTDGSVAARQIEAGDQDSNEDNGDNNDDHGDHEYTGVIQSVDQNAHTFVLLPDGKTTPVTIAFDSKTDMEGEHEDGGKNAGLVAGAHVKVEVITQSNGSLYAKEIQPASNNQGSGGQGGDNGGDGHNGQPTPTPGTGSGG